MKSFTDSFVNADRLRLKSVPFVFHFTFTFALSIFLLLLVLVPSPYAELFAVDPLDSDLSYQSESTPFVTDLVKIRFPEKAEVRRLGTQNHWKIIPRQGRAWMMILREWEGVISKEETLSALLKELFPESKDIPVPDLRGIKIVAGERKEIVSGNPLTVRYYLLEQKGKTVSIYLGFDSDNRTISDYFQTPKNFLRTLSDSF
ncbi:acyltransferase [Leptospira sp. FAT2]|uniref:acyltransferase n=1 Tax=Leptospira sanjuanensis TaxID=2879643 RepID=UPI001EE84F72|nr:acyltransferase [Leptospira sanjuanensis]MCG6193188.1 acyltransferase [Leptospira sanjuanensis]